MVPRNRLKIPLHPDAALGQPLDFRHPECQLQAQCSPDKSGSFPNSTTEQPLLLGKVLIDLFQALPPYTGKIINIF